MMAFSSPSAVCSILSLMLYKKPKFDDEDDDLRESGNWKNERRISLKTVRRSHVHANACVTHDTDDHSFHFC